MCNSANITYVPEWISRVYNSKADALSRRLDQDDWFVHDGMFRFLDAKWGPHDVDRFASNLNNKCRRFNSKWWVPGVEAVNCFDQDWQGVNNWLVPPPSGVLKSLKKLQSDYAVGTLIIPEWESASFWPYIIDDKGVYKNYVKDNYNLPSSAICCGKGSKGMFSKAKMSFRMVALRCDFHSV